MLHLKSFVFSPFSENTYIMYNEHKECIIVDPGMYDQNERNQFFEFIEESDLKPKMLLNTHCHLDHVFGVQAVLEKFDIPFFFHELELPVYDHGEQVAKTYGVNLSLPKGKHQFISENETVALGEDVLEIRLTPGHSPGSICFYYPKASWIVSGDVMFRQSIGRTDLPGGDFDTLIKSVREQLFTLPDDTVVHSGHGPETTVGFEKENNPFLNM